VAGQEHCAPFTVEAVNERERTTDHDVAASGDVLSESAGDAGRWVHVGLTSSDVLDTATGLQLRAADEILVAGARALEAALAERAHTVCVGRTHGVRAEPTTFGIKLAGFAMEARRNAERLACAFAQASVGAIFGAVGTYAATSPEFEARVLAGLGIEPEPVSTQVVARRRADRRAAGPIRAPQSRRSALTGSAPGVRPLPRAYMVSALHPPHLRPVVTQFFGAIAVAYADPRKRMISDNVSACGRVTRTRFV
jgi:hypothetical protein